MVVAVQQTSAGSTGLFTVCIVKHCAPNLCSDKTQNLHRSTVKRIPRQCTHPRQKVDVLATHLYTSPQRDASVSSAWVLSNTAPLPVQWQYTKHAQINGETDIKTEPASKSKGQCAGNAPNTLMLANRPRTTIIEATNSALESIQLPYQNCKFHSNTCIIYDMMLIKCHHCTTKLASCQHLTSV